MKRMLKITLAVLLALTLVFTALPFTAFAALDKITSVVAMGNGAYEYLYGYEWAPTQKLNALTEVSDGIWEITYPNVWGSDYGKLKDFYVIFALNTLDENGDPVSDQVQYHLGTDYDVSYDINCTFDGIMNGEMILFHTERDEEGGDKATDIKFRVDLTNFDFETKTGAKISILDADVPEPEPEPDTYTVAGSSTDIFGSEWDINDTDNDFEYSEEDEIISKTYYNAEPEDNIRLKVVKNRDWNTCYPEGDNYTFSIARECDITVYFNRTTGEVWVTGDAVEPPDTSEKYDLWLGKRQVTENNKDDIFGDGKASFDPNTNTLTLNDPEIKGVYTDGYNETYKIYTDLDLTLEGQWIWNQYDADTAIYSSKSLAFEGYFQVNSKEYAVYARMGIYFGEGMGIFEGAVKSINKDITISNRCSRVDVTILDGQTNYPLYAYTNINVPENLIIKLPEDGMVKSEAFSRIVQSDGTTAEMNRVVIRKDGAMNGYDLWLGDTQVTETNQDDILGNHKAWYDPDLNELHLEKPEILSKYKRNGTSYKIFSTIEGLTISGKFDMSSVAEPDIALKVADGTVINGRGFDFIGKDYGIYSSGSLTFSHGSVYAKGSNDGIKAKGNITITNRMESVCALGGITGNYIFLDNGVGISYPENAVVEYGTITVDGEKANEVLIESSDVEINEINLTITAPAAGEFPSFTAGGEQGYDISTVEWFDTADDSPVTGEFESGHQYYVGIVAAAQDGYAFAMNPTATVNGEAAETAEIEDLDSSKYLIVCFCFPEIEDGGNGELVDEETSIKVVTDDDVELVVDDITDAPETGDIVIDGAKIDKVYDITLVKDGEPVQPSSDVTVKIPCDDPDAKVYRVEVDGTLSDMGARYEDGYLVFQTDHFSVYILASSEDELTIGDINKDGAIDVLDALMIHKYSVDKLELTDEEIYLADVNGDGTVDILDATLIQKYAVDKISEFPKKA